jgi:hypothetical protein
MPKRDPSHPLRSLFSATNGSLTSADRICPAAFDVATGSASAACRSSTDPKGALRVASLLPSATEIIGRPVLPSGIASLEPAVEWSVRPCPLVL